MRLRFPSPPSPDRVEQLLTRAAPGRLVDASVMSDAPDAHDDPGSERSRPGRGPRHRDLRPPPPAVLTLPGPLRGASVRPAWLAVAGLVLVGLVALALLAGRAAIARVAAAPTPVAAPTSPTASGGSALDASERPKESPGGGSTAVSASASSGGPVLVHVVGHVRTPGVVTVTAGARMRDAVTAAGGPLASAELGVVNLARVVIDGEQISVPARGSPEASAAAAAAAAPGSGPSARGAAGSAGAGDSGGPVNLNSADAAALDTLPGVGPVTAKKILEWRQKHGRFTRVEELGEVPGIGPKLLAQLTAHVTV
ncbi:MAG: ComEA family DNA-binding protein [Dermatophilaceae bacterium]